MLFNVSFYFTQGHTKVLANTPLLVKRIGCLKDDG